MKKVLVIVVTYNGRQWLERCLSSVCPVSQGEMPGNVVSSGAEGGIETSLFVVDNDSTDGSADFVALHFPQAKLVRSAENLLFSAANNLGFKYALKKGFDYVYLLNQDAWLAPGALETLVASAELHPEYAVLSPLQMTDAYKSLDPQFAKLYGSGEVFSSQTASASLRPLPSRDAASDKSSSQPTVGPSLLCGRGWPQVCEENTSPEPMSVKRVMAAHWLVPCAALKKIGLFEEKLFPLYGQDDDWCNRARYHGFKIGIVPSARAVHDRAERKEAKEKIVKRNYYTGSLVRLCDLNRPLWERFMFVCAFTLVKSIKYRSLLPLKYFRTICRQLPAVRAHRLEYR